MRHVFVVQVVILMIFLALTFANEVLDVPHLLFGDPATSWQQRSGEIGIELTIFVFVVAVEVFLFRRLARRIKILEGFLPICAGCKKIRTRESWEQVEAYITEHSLAKFSHSLCPECRERLYPDLPRSGGQ